MDIATNRCAALLIAGLTVLMTATTRAQSPREETSWWPDAVDHVVAGPVFVEGGHGSHGLRHIEVVEQVLLANGERILDGSRVHAGDIVMAGTLANHGSAAIDLVAGNGSSFALLAGESVAIGTHVVEFGEDLVQLSVAAPSGGRAVVKGTFKLRCTCRCGSDPIKTVALEEGESCVGQNGVECVTAAGNPDKFNSCKKRKIEVDD